MNWLAYPLSAHHRKVRRQIIRDLIEMGDLSGHDELPTVLLQASITRVLTYDSRITLRPREFYEARTERIEEI